MGARVRRHIQELLQVIIMLVTQSWSMAAGSMGDYGVFISVWEDDGATARFHIRLPFSSGGQGNLSLLVSPDASMICVSDSSGAYLVNASNGTFFAVPELSAGAGSNDPYQQPVGWSPVGAFVSGKADYAYYLSSGAVSELPGPIPEVVGTPGFSVLPHLGIIIEGRTNISHPDDAVITARDLFSGEPFSLPAWVTAGFMPGLPPNPSRWSDTGWLGTIAGSPSSAAMPLAGVMGELDGWQLPLDSKVLTLPTETGLIVIDSAGARHVTTAGDIDRVYAGVPGHTNSLTATENVLFRWNGSAFFRPTGVGVATADTVYEMQTSGPVVGVPAFLNTPALWGSLTDVAIWNIASPVELFSLQAGAFWQNMRYASEVSL